MCRRLIKKIWVINTVRFSKLQKEISVVLLIKFIALFMIWYVVVYHNSEVKDELALSEHLLK